MASSSRSTTAARQLVAETRQTVRMLRDPTLLMWALYILLVPIYVWASGLPQPGDYLVVLLAPIALARWNGRVPRSAFPAVRALLMFTLYVIVVNLVWSVVLGAWSISLKRGFGLSPLFYVFNSLVFLVVLVLHQIYRERLFYVTTRIVLLSLFTQVVLSGVLATGGRRATILFNNPNQLGYFALLSASVLVVMQRRRYATTLEVALGTVCATYLGLLSASKAALGGIILLGVVGLVTRLRTMVLIGIAMALLLVIPSPMNEALNGAMNRIDTDQSHGFAEERGYDRIPQHPEYWLLGSGEGAYNRFKETTVIGAHEIHSSLGTLFFSYGIVGTLMFASFLWRVLKGSGFTMWLMVAPSLAYGMTHQGLRFTMVWLLLALVTALREPRPPVSAPVPAG